METRKEFVRIGDDLETAAAKNAQVSRHKAGEAERASHLLLATRKCYQHFALDYCLQVGRLPSPPSLHHVMMCFVFLNVLHSLIVSAQHLQDAAESRHLKLRESNL